MTSTSSWATALWPHASSGWTARERPLFQLHQPPDARPRLFNLMGGTFIQDSNGNGPMKAYVAEWSPAWDAGLRTGDVLISINGRKNPYPDLVEYVTTQRGLRPAWWSSAGTGWCASNGKFRPRPLPGIITPRPRPLRNRNSKTTSGSRKKRTDPALRRRPAASGYGRRNSG